MIDLTRVKSRIKQHEGYSSCPYRCPAGEKTIGWGYSMDAHSLPSDIKVYLDANGIIAPSHSERLLSMSVEEALAGCRDIWTAFDSYPVTVQEALVDFVYNVGQWGALKFKKAVAAIEARDWKTAADEMTDSLWYKQVGQRGRTVVGLIREADNA